MLGLGLAIPQIAVTHASAPSYDSAATAYFAAMSVQPDATRKGLLNALIVGLKADGVWALLDWLSILAAHDAQAARINAKTPAQVASVVGTPTFTTDRGYTGDGAGSYLETGYADTSGGNYAQDSASLFTWANATFSGTSAGLSGSVNSRLLPATQGVRVNSGAVLNGTVANSLGLCLGSRTDSVTLGNYRNGASISSSGANASQALTGGTFQFLHGSTFSGTGRLAVGGFGAGLDATKEAALYSRLNTFLTAIGGA